MSIWVDFFRIGQVSLRYLRPRPNTNKKYYYFFVSLTDFLFSRREDSIKPINAYGSH